MWQLNFAQWSLYIHGSSSMKLWNLVSFHPSGFSNYEVLPRFLENFCKPVKMHRSFTATGWWNEYLHGSKCCSVYHCFIIATANFDKHTSGCNSDTLLHSDMQESVLSLSLSYSLNKFDIYTVIQTLILENYGVTMWNKIFPSQQWGEELYVFNRTARCIHMMCVSYNPWSIQTKLLVCVTNFHFTHTQS